MKTEDLKAGKREIKVNVLEGEMWKKESTEGKKQQMKSFKFMSVMLKWDCA